MGIIFLLKSSTNIKFVAKMFLLVLSLSFTLTQVNLAEEVGEGMWPKAFKLGQVVVTATRTERQIANVPASVTVIDKKQIEASPFERIDDILRSVVGLDVNYHYGMHTVGGTRPVNFRGTGGYGDRTLVLVDGVLQNNPINNWVEWSQIPKDAVERVEIVRGPASALYGSSAMGGVINIITKKPERARQTSFEQRYGSMDTWTTKLVQEGRIRNLGYYLSGEYEETDGYVASKPQRAWDIKRFREEVRIFSKLIYDIDEASSVTIGFSHYHNEKGCGREFFYGSSKSSRGWLDWTRCGEKIDWRAQIFLNDVEWSSYHDGPPSYNYLYHHEIIPMLGLGGSIQSNIDFSDQNSLTIGIDYKHNDFERDDKFFTKVRSAGAEGKQHYLSPFINEELRFFDQRLIISLGGRYDWIKSYDGKNWDDAPEVWNPGLQVYTPLSRYSNRFSSKEWSEFSPKLGISYHLSEFSTLKSSIGMGFRAPSLYELYVTDLRGPLYLECNPELEPEKIISYDLGIEHLFLENLWGRITFYQSHAKDFIGFDTITNYHWKNDNISKVRIRGIEAELDWMVSSEWSCFANYTYNKSEIREYATDPTVEGNYLPYTPRNKYGLGFSYTSPKLFDFKCLFTYHDKRYANNQNTSKLEGYPMLNLSISRQFGKYFKFSLDGENLFDEDYTLYKGVTEDTVAPGRVITVSCKIKF